MTTFVWVESLKVHSIQYSVYCMCMPDGHIQFAYCTVITLYAHKSQTPTVTSADTFWYTGLLFHQSSGAGLLEVIPGWLSLIFVWDQAIIEMYQFSDFGTTEG